MTIIVPLYSKEKSLFRHLLPCNVFMDIAAIFILPTGTFRMFGFVRILVSSELGI